MLNSVEINKLSRACKNMDLGGKIVAMFNLVSALQQVVLNHCMSAAGLAIGTSDPAKVKIVNTVNYVVAGLFKSKTTAEVAFTAVTHDIAANATLVKEASYTIALSANGTASITMGAIAVGAGNSIQPPAPANTVEIGRVIIAVAAGATSFTAGTTQLSNGALTVTYTDQLCRPTDLVALLGQLTSL